MTVQGDWDMLFNDLPELQGFLADEDMVDTRERANLCVEQTESGNISIELLSSAFCVPEVVLDNKRLPTPPPSGGVEGELVLESFLLGDAEEETDHTKPMPCLAGPQPSTPDDSVNVSSSISTPAPPSPSASPPPEHNPNKRPREEADNSSSDRSKSPEGNVGDLALRPQDDPQGLFTRDLNSLSCEELKMLKKQKRLIKNRESAQLSRHRKKQHVEGLQVQVRACPKLHHVLI